MKKLLMFLFLMTISLGQSQTLVGTWKVTSIGVGASQGQTNYFSLSSTSGARACFFDDEYVFDADGDFHNVQQGETYLEVWQGPEGCGVPVAPHNGSNAATYSSTATTLTLTGVGAYLGLAKVITDSEISSPSAAPASVTYLLTSLTTTTLTVDVPLSNGAWWRFVLSNEVVNPPPPVAVPTVAANTPTQAAGDVISVYSDAYTSVNVLTFRTDWSNGVLENVTIAGNPTLKYNGLNFVGIDINPANQIDATSMETFHIDMWTPDCTTFKVKIVDFGPNGVYGGGDDKEHEVTRTPIQNGWNYFDLPLSEFTGLTTRANINQLVLVSSGGTAYVDNMYFWKLPSGSQSYYVDADGDGFGAGAATVSSTPIAGSVTNATDCNDSSSVSYPGATEIADGLDNDCDGSVDEGFPPSTGSPNTPPARNAWDVVSIFSEAYSNVTLEELPTSWSGLNSPFSVETIGGNPTWKFDGEFLGIVTNYGSGVNLTDMTTMHIDYWTPDNKIMIAKIVNTVDGISEGLTIVEDPVVTGTWRSVDIPMTAFGGSVNKSKITQIILDPQAGGSTVYVDNFYFYRPETGAPSPSIGAFTVPAKVIGDANFELTAPSSNSAGAFSYSSSNESVATISGTTVTIVGAGSSIITATQAAAGAYGSGSTTATLVVSLATSAPAPTVPGDRVLSIFSDAAGYANVEGTQFYPNWGQSTQYALESIAGNPTIRYSNLNYQGIQLGSVIDISSYDTVHLNIYGAGTSAVDFRVINQVGGAGSPDVERIANRAITLNPGWNSIEFPVSYLTTATPGFELNRVGQLMFVGSGTIYVDNIFFSKATPTPVAPTVTDIAFCKGSASALTAIPSGNNALRWYSSSTSTVALASAPIPTATKTYYVAQVMSSGVVSPKAAITATINLLPPTPASMTTSDAVLCKHIGTTNAVTYSVPALAGITNYSWSLPSGVTATSATDTNAITVNFLGASTSIAVGGIGTISARAISAQGCSSAPRSLILSSKLPTAPTSLTLTSADTAEDFNSGVPSVPSSLSDLSKITKVGPYMGTSTVFTLTAASAPTAASYAWTLPDGVNQLTGGTSNVITVDFADVTPGIEALPVVVKSAGGCGQSAARTLTLSRAVPTAPTALVLTDDAISTTTALTKVSAYTGKSTPLTLKATPVRVQGATATSYAWRLPAGVNIVSPAATATTISVIENQGSVEVPNLVTVSYAALSTGTASTITIDFANVASGTLSFPLTVYAVNGTGNSKARTRTVTAAAPTSPAITAVGGTTFNSCNTKTYSVVQTPGTSYAWTVPAGATYTGGTGNTIVVDYTNVAASVGATVQVTCAASNGTGSSLPKVLNVKRVLCPVRLADSSASAFSAKAYPNPSSSEFTIETSAKGAMSVKVYDMQGRLVEKANTDKVGSRLAAGAYNIIVNQGANTKSVRVIKK